MRLAGGFGWGGWSVGQSEKQQSTKLAGFAVYSGGHHVTIIINILINKRQNGRGQSFDIEYMHFVSCRTLSTLKEHAFKQLSHTYWAQFVDELASDIGPSLRLRQCQCLYDVVVTVSKCNNCFGALTHTHAHIQTDAKYMLPSCHPSGASCNIRLRVVGLCKNRF